MMPLDEGSIWSPTKSEPESSNVLFSTKLFFIITLTIT